MLKVFLVEDETIIREGLCNIIPWQQYGYTLVGDASDGEQALPMIRELQPDVLITDIKMPFMDGLALSNLVSKELPNTKIIIVSGYDDFEYARQAIRIGVEQYLLKPITKAMLIKTLNEVQEKIQSEREQKNYLEKFRSEMQEYEQFSNRRFFEQIVAGQLSVQEIYEQADRLNIAIHAQCYNIVMYGIQAEPDTALGSGGRTDGGAKADPVLRSGARSDVISQIRDGLNQFFMMYPEYLMFRWNLNTYAVLIKGDRVQIDTLTQRCVDTIQEYVQPFEETAKWYVAIGEKTERLSGLPACFDQVNHIFSFRYLMSSQHILTRENTDSIARGEDENSLSNLDASKIDPRILRGFLQDGQIEEIDNFVEEYVGSLHDAASSKLFCQYLMLDTRFAAIAYIEELGYSQEQFLDMLPGMQKLGTGLTVEELKHYIRAMLTCAVDLRERQSKSQNKGIVRQALDYIDKNFADENISLKEVAGYTKVSANYFSAVFSQEMRQTFVEYLTQKRMERAKELLRQTDKRSAEVAAEVGYKDPHYFSFVFRKTQGCSPRDYRTGGKRG